MTIQVENASIRRIVTRAVTDVKVTDMHTHLYSPHFGSLLLRGIDELLTYHYLIAEALRWIDIPYDSFWALQKSDQADLVWRTLFIERSPISESCRGVLTVLDLFGLDVSSRNLNEYRSFFRGMSADEHIDRVLELAGVESLVMTNDPFDDIERNHWDMPFKDDQRFHTALRLDVLLNAWESTCRELRRWKYDVTEDLGERTIAEAKRFLRDWIERIDPLYMALSLPPDFEYPEDSSRGHLIEKCVLPTADEYGLPIALMIGVKRLCNPALRQAGDSMGKGNIETVERLCLSHPTNRFMVTMLSRENQHELSVTARKFRNLMVFGCWWFLNNPSLIEETTKMRIELLGESVIPLHSDSRVLDQLIYKWAHSRKIIAEVLVDKYSDLADTGWKPSEAEIRQDVDHLFKENFWNFIGRARRPTRVLTHKPYPVRLAQGAKH